jgi:two-component system OmpR family sensor kinase
VLSLPVDAVMSDLDPDAFAILLRNLVENALRHASPDAPVDVALLPDGTLRVANDGPVLPPDVLGRLMNRFERAGAKVEGSGLGLAIVAAIAERTGSRLVLHSSRPGRDIGFAAEVRLPASTATRS